MVEAKHITKSFGGVQSLKDVNLQVRAGEIHAILGENGAGKSTLMKIISGAYMRNSGSLTIDGEVVNFRNPQEARKKGVGIIYQEFSLIPALSAAENIFLNTLGKTALIGWKKLNAEAEIQINKLGFDIDVTLPVAQLSIAEQQVVEIAKALTTSVKVLILDEPSAVLGPGDIKKLFAVLRMLRDQGTAIMYISHHLDELFELCDRVTILKDGVTVQTLDIHATTRNALVELMLGRTLSQMFPVRNSSRNASFPLKRYIVENISVNGRDQLSLQIQSGEIVGIGGLVGSGRTEFLQAVFGARHHSGKRMRVNDEDIIIRNPRQAVLKGIGMVPEDRKNLGGLMQLSVKENISLSGYRKIRSAFGFIRSAKEEAIIQDLVRRLNIKLGSVNHTLNTLSGGNQQKVVLAKWLNTDAELLLIDEPTRGVDVGARAEIYQLIYELADKGLAIIMVSSDWEELMGMSDRILVMRAGKVQGSLQREEFSEETLLRMAIGATV